MDHEWGRNVTDFGLAAVGATLAARYLALPFVFLTNAPGTSPGTTQIWFTHPNPDIPWTLFQVGFPVSRGNFPYGEPVFPDVDL